MSSDETRRFRAALMAQIDQESADMMDWCHGNRTGVAELASSLMDGPASWPDLTAEMQSRIYQIARTAILTVMDAQTQQGE